MMRTEMVAGFGSIAMTLGGWCIAQAEVSTLPTSITGLITQAGGLGLAVWLVYHHTTVTIPTMQKLHADERAESLRGFEKILDEKRTEYFKEITRQQEQFTDLIGKASCKYKADNK